ncbi:MAG: hypothetical protein N3A68_04790 [Bacteroidia bacterium]|nr:hypothetical protein [Bacteroidia bacterium]
MRRVKTIIGLLGGWLFAQPLVTIQQIQTPQNLAAGNDTSVWHGQTVRVRGVVMTRCDWHRHYGVSGGANSKRCSIWLQDSMSSGPRTGLQIRRQNTTDMPPNFTALQQGQYVELVGTVGYFQGEIQLNVDTNTSPVILAPNIPLAPPTPINVSDLNLSNGSHNLAVGEQWQGSYVKLTNLTINSVATNPVRLTCTDANGYQIVVFGEFKGLGSTRTYTAGTRLDSVKGIILHYWPATGTPMYEICPWHDSMVYIGNAVPLVSSHNRTPVCPGPTDNVQVQVNAEGMAGDPVTSVTLYWATGASTTYTAVPMTQQGATTTYTATIPAQAEGTYVHYYIVAQDQSGDMVKYPTFEPYSYRVNSAGCRITDIQYVVPSVIYAYNPSGRRDYLSSGYRGLSVSNVPGVVTATENDLGYVHIQQTGAPDWAGIWVRPTGGAPTLNIGDSVIITNATVDEYFGLTNLQNAVITRVGLASAPITPTVLPLNVIYGDTQYAATEPYESMLVRFRHDNPAQVLHVVQPQVSTQSQHAGDYRVGMDPASPLQGVRVLAGRQTSNIFSSLKVSYVNDSTWAVTDGLIDPTIPLCIVADTTELDSIQGIFTYQWNFVKLLPRNNNDFFRVTKTTCTTGGGGGGGPSALAGRQDLPLTVYPNPTQGYLHIALPQEYGWATARLQTLEGRELWRGRFLGQWEGSLAELPAGLYLLRVSTAAGEAVARIIRTY